VKSKDKIYALRFISGKYKGGEVPLPEDREVIIGRSHEIDIILLEDMVSRRHAKIYKEGDNFVIEDLNSTNGTFVNGERIKKRVLKEGDRILIGTSMMKLVVIKKERSIAPTIEEQITEVRRDTAISKEITATESSSQRVRGMVGSLSDVPLMDLLQLFSNNRKTGLLLLKKREEEGTVYIKEGNIIFANLKNKEYIEPLKALYKLLRWQDGSFEFIKEEVDETKFDKKIELPVEMIIMEGMRIWDEFKRIEKKLPPLNSKVKVKLPLESKLRELSPEELDIFQFILNSENNIEEILDKAPFDEITTANILLKLYEKGYIIID